MAREQRRPTTTAIATAADRMAAGRRELVDVNRVRVARDGEKRACEVKIEAADPGGVGPSPELGNLLCPGRLPDADDSSCLARSREERPVAVEREVGERRLVRLDDVDGRQGERVEEDDIAWLTGRAGAGR